MTTHAFKYAVTSNNGLVLLDVTRETGRTTRLVLSAPEARMLVDALEEHAGVAELDCEEKTAELKEAAEAEGGGA